MINKNINERILDSVGYENYNEYILLTNGQEIDSILNSSNPVYKMYNYRHGLLDKEVGQNVKSDELKNNNGIKLKQLLETIFLDHLTDSKFRIVKNILLNHIGGWNIERLLDIHKKHKYYRIFRLLNISYNNWLN